MRAAELSAINKARHERRAIATLTDLEGGRTQMFNEGDAFPPDVGDRLQAAFRTGKSSVIEAGDRRLFLNVYLPAPKIAVIGAVHITQALGEIARTAGYDLRIIDPRTAFATPERFAGVDLVADWPEDALKEKPLDAYTALVAVTHDPKIDDFPIIDALRRGCFYVGALGSRKTHAKRVERLLAAGLSEELISRIDAPIGVDIGAQSPQEIAVAIMAAIIQSFRRRALK